MSDDVAMDVDAHPPTTTTTTTVQVTPTPESPIVFRKPRYGPPATDELWARWCGEWIAMIEGSRREMVPGEPLTMTNRALGRTDWWRMEKSFHIPVLPPLLREYAAAHPDLGIVCVMSQNKEHQAANLISFQWNTTKNQFDNQAKRNAVQMANERQKNAAAGGRGRGR